MKLICSDEPMKKIVQNALLPFAIFTGALVLMGCGPAPSEATDSQQHSNNQSSTSMTASTEENTTSSATEQEFKSGSMLYIVRDVADMQLKTGEYMSQLQDTQQVLEQAVSDHNTVALQKALEQLKQQLTSFNAALETLNLKSQEIHNIRENILANNEKLLATPWLNGEVAIKDIDIAALEKQMGNIQGEVIKLASMLVQSSAEKN